MLDPSVHDTSMHDPRVHDPTMHDPSMPELTVLQQQLLQQPPWPPLPPSGTVPRPQLVASSSPCVWHKQRV